MSLITTVTTTINNKGCTSIMLWFKNAIVYQITNDNLLEINNIQNAVKAQPFMGCGATDVTKSGWISPYFETSIDDIPMLEIDGQILLRLKKETKLLPTPVIKQAVNEKIDLQEQKLSRKLSKNEKIALKEETLIDLLPRAFSKYQFYWVWIDTVNKKLVLDVSSFKVAEDILAILRKPLGTLAVIPFSSSTPTEQIMTQWIMDPQQCQPFILGDEIELKDSLEESSVVKCKNQELTSHEITVHLEAGKIVSKIKLVDETGGSFILNRDCTLKKLKFDASISEQNEDFLPEEKDKRLEADFILMSNMLNQSLKNLFLVLDK